MKNPTLRKRFIPKLLLILLPLVIFVNLYNFKITHVLRDQAASSGSEFSTIYMREIDASLSNLRHWLVSLSEDTKHLAKFSSDNASEREQERQYYSGLIKDASELHPTLDMAFIISPKYSQVITSSSKNVTFEEHQAFSKLAKDIAQYHKPIDTEWTAMFVPSKNECWLCSIIVLDNVVLGVMIG